MSSVKVHVSSPDTFSERTYDLHLTVGQLKKKLEPVTGIPVEFQRLTLHRDQDESEVLRALDDDNKPLGFFSVSDWMLIKVADTSGTSAGQFTDVSKVDKYELPKEEYETRRDTVLAYKKLHKMGRFADSTESTEAPPAQPGTAVSPEIKAGARCEVTSVDDGFKKRGTVRFIGPTKFGKDQGSIWVGVEYDEPVGKNDGLVQGERYFTCQMGYGAFVRPDKVHVGDFPLQDPFADDEEI